MPAVLVKRAYRSPVHAAAPFLPHELILTELVSQTVKVHPIVNLVAEKVDARENALHANAGPVGA